MIKLKPFKTEDWQYINQWIANESELIQFAGQIFTFPIDKNQIENYLSNSKKRTVFRIENENDEPIGMAEISIEDENVAKLARILIGEKSLRGKGVGTELINQLTEYAVKNLKKKTIRLNVYQWNIGAMKCYQKAGFTQTDKPTKYVKVGDETWKITEMEITSTNANKNLAFIR